MKHFEATSESKFGSIS